jgi:hypothetical protein
MLDTTEVRINELEDKSVEHIWPRHWMNKDEKHKKEEKIFWIWQKGLIQVVLSPEGKQRMGQKEYLKNNGQDISKTDKRH